MSLRSRRLLLGTGIVVLLLAPCLGWYAVFHAPAERQAERLEAKLEQDVAGYHAYWGHKTRPTLGGEPEEGDAAEEARRIASRMAAPELPEDLTERLAAGEPPAEVVELVERKEADLAALRETTQRRTAWVRLDVERGGAAVPMPEYMPVIRAVKLLAVQASLAEPEECLQVTADAIRIAQDAGRGAGLLGTAVAAAMIESVAPVVGPCLARAGRFEREDAAGRFALLAVTAPAIGAALELEALLSAATFRLAARAPLIPTTGEELDQVMQRDEVLEAWAIVGRDPAQFRAMRPGAYPESVEVWQREARARGASGNPLLAMATPSMARYLELDMATQARVRALTVLAEALAAVEPGEPLPAATPQAVTDADVRDPFTGDPLLWTASGDEACVYSVGPDGSDDGCSPESDDVGARVTLERDAPEQPL